METVRIAAVGDTGVGNTSLLMTYGYKEFPLDKRFLPNSHWHNIDVKINFREEKQVNLILRDTAGQKDYDKLRPLEYPFQDLFIICFSLDEPDTLENIRLKWFPEIKNHASEKPIFLVGTKLDLIEEKNIERRKIRAKARKIGKEIGAVKCLECSALKNVGLSDLFDEAAKPVLIESRPTGRSYCIIL